MIRIICSRETYVYNVYHMVKAFYPSQEAASCVEEKAYNYVTVLFEEEREIFISQDTVGKEEQYDTGEMKYRIDCILYRALKERTKKELAWGILMGVRPTKIAMAELLKGTKREDFTPWFQEHFLASRGKAELAWQVAVREKGLLDRLDAENGYSLYVGIPFCPSVCSYCSFSSGSLSDWKERTEDYMQALLREIKAVAGLSAGKHLNTVYIGGGTPTALTACQLDRLLSCIDAFFSKEHLLEYTVEAGRPDSITEEKLKVLGRHGVTRISINPQSMQRRTLELIGRRHTPEDVIRAYEMARNMGFDNINMDLIVGLPGERFADVEDTLEKIKELSPDSLTVHSLAIKRAARMGRREEGKEVKEKTAAPEDIARMIERSADAASEMGMSPYYLYRQKNIAGNFENTGYAKVDKAGIYNILIMEEKQSIIAAGAGASTKLVLKEPAEHPANKKKKTNLIRIENVKAIDAYISRVGEMIKRKEEWLWR